MKSRIATISTCVTALGMLIAAQVVAQSKPASAFGQVDVKQVDVKRVQRFCDVGFRFVEGGIKFDLEKLLGLGISVDPKVLQAVSSHGAVQIVVLTHLCHAFAIGQLTPETYVQSLLKILEYAKDLEAVRAKAEETAKVPVSKKEDGRLDAAQVAKAELGLVVESSMDLGGELSAILRRLTQRYSCNCRPEKK